MHGEVGPDPSEPPSSGPRRLDEGLLGGVRRLVSSGPLAVAFQPIVDLATGALWAHEALGRIGPVPSELATICESPATLLDAAHRAGCLTTLDRRWRQLAIDAVALDPRTTLCFLNIDPRIAEEPDFAPGFTHGRITAAGLHPSRFVLELTEAHGEKTDLIERAVEHYLAQGFLVALDDVGSGAQSLERVLRLAPPLLKLDRSLIQGLDHDRARRHLVAALVELARDIDARVVAEGIETREELIAVVRSGAHFAQGWFLGRPTPRPGDPLPDARRVIEEARRPHRSPLVSATTQPLLDLVDGLASSIDLASALQLVTDCTASALRTERVSLRLLDASREGLLVAARTGPSLHDDPGTRFVRGEGLVGEVMATNRPLRLRSVADDPRFVEKPGSRAAIGSFLGAPLRDDQGCFGVLSTTTPQTNAFDEDDERVLRLICGVVAPHLQVRRLARLAQIDPLTGLLNRRALDAAIPDRSGAASLSVALIDIDHFKSINDQHGHAAGDDALRALARELTAAIRTDDHLLRLGGEEFLLVLPNASLEDVRLVAEELRKRVRQLVRVAGEPLTISIGVTARVEGEARDLLLARADAALYRAKALGRDRVVAV